MESPDRKAPPEAAYIHVPFCRHRCGYCDFTLVARRDDLVERYLAALQKSLESLGSPRSVQSLFFGGGTPTHLEPQPLRDLLRLATEWFSLPAEGEFSVEANPSGLDEARIGLLADAGVNRISLGVQSFELRHLATLERDHTPQDVTEVMDRLRPRFANISLDLIFAVPGQTLEEWERTIDQATALAPTHISTYGLTWERGTSFWSRRNRGALQPVAEELERDMYGLAMDRLTAAGFEHYELSNFARPGFRCRHNQVYWRGDEYFGFGPGAASYLDGVRRLNHRSVTTWINRVLRGEPAIQDEETLSAEDRAREAIMLGLRQIEGIELRRFAARYGCTPASLEPREFEQHLARGLCEVVDGRWRLTRAGCFVADSIMSAYL